MKVRPIGEKVLVMFPQTDWKVGDDGFVKFTGLWGEGYRMDGLVVATNGHTPPEIGVGTTVYGDPRKGDILVVDGTRYHMMKNGDIEAKAEM